MALIEEALYEHLKNDVAITAMVGNKLFPMQMTQGTPPPSVVFQRISDDRDLLLAGPQCVPTPRFQFSCWGRNYIESVALARLVRLRFDGFAGTMGVINTVEVLRTKVDNAFDNLDDDTRTGLFRRVLDIVIEHRET